MIPQNQKIMFKQMRTLNLKFFGMILFAIALLVGGFFLSTPSAGAVEKVQSFSAVYTLSSPTSQPNTDGGASTFINVGCSPLSGDKYDINTGKTCTGTPPKILIGCAPRSIDLYDINTGEKCKNNTTPVIVGCASGSGHIFDITTGKRCTNDTKPVISACKPGSGDLFNTTTGKPCPVIKSTATLSKSTQNANINKNIITQVVKTTDTPIDTPISYIEPVETENFADESQSEEEDILNTASAGKIGIILNGPMSIWIILLIVVIVLTGGFGIYGLVNKDKRNGKIKTAPQPQSKIPNTQAPVSNNQPSNNQQPNQQKQIFNTNQQAKAQEIPFSDKPTNTANSQGQFPPK